jgi:hypothetical protein
LCLYYCSAFVIMLIYKMDGDARFFFVRSYYCMTYIPLPPYFGNNAGWMLMIFPGNPATTDSGTFHRNPARTNNEGLYRSKTSTKASSLKDFLSISCTGIWCLDAISNTPASGLLQTISATKAFCSFEN